MAQIQIGLNLEFSRHHDMPFIAAVEKAARMGYKFIEPMVHLIMAPLVLKTLMRDSLDLCCPGSASIDPRDFIDHHLDMLLHALAARADPSVPR